MDIILYTSNCPKCLILEKKLNEKKLSYETCTDIRAIDEVLSHNDKITSFPFVQIDGQIYDFKAALNYVNKQEVK